MCDDAPVEINCWHEVGRKGAKKDVVRLRKLPVAEVKQLRAAIRDARAGSADGVVLEVERGFSSRGRAIARLVVGIGTVIVFFGAVAAFVAPSAAMAIVGFGVVPAGLAAGLTVFFSYSFDTGLVIHGDGRMRVAGWGGIRDIDLTDRQLAALEALEDRLNIPRRTPRKNEIDDLLDEQL